MIGRQHVGISFIVVSLSCDLEFRQHVAQLASKITEYHRSRPGSCEIICVIKKCKPSDFTDVSWGSDGINVAFVSQMGKGIYDAMNIGIMAASKEYIYFSNVGDSLLQIPDSLNTDVELFPVRNVGRLRDKIRTPTEKKNMGQPHQGAFVRKAVYVDLNGFNLTYKFVADYDFWLRLYQTGYTIKYNDTPVALFRLGGVSNQVGTYIERMVERLIAQRNAELVKRIRFTALCKIILTYPFYWLYRKCD